LSALERVHIRITKQQMDFIRMKYGNLSQWVRSKIDREIGAEEVRYSGGPSECPKQKAATNVTAWKFPR